MNRLCQNHLRRTYSRLVSAYFKSLILECHKSYLTFSFVISYPQHSKGYYNLNLMMKFLTKINIMTKLAMIFAIFTKIYIGYYLYTLDSHLEMPPFLSHF